MADERVDRFIWPPKAPQRDAGGVGVDPDATEAAFIEIKDAEGGGGPRVGRETAEAGGLMGRVTHAITIRNRPDVTPRQRFRMDARVFDIISVIDTDEAHRFLTCLVEERLG